MIDIEQEQSLIVPMPDSAQRVFVPQGYGLVPIGEPTFEEWIAFGETIKNVEKGVHFWIGDWLNYGEAKWGEMYEEAAKRTGFEYHTLRKDKHVASRVELFRRRNNLSFSHHEEVAPY